jgi:hypothetical protein
MMAIHGVLALANEELAGMRAFWNREQDTA